MEKLGRYELIRKLAAGGMAEVLLARQTGLEGFEKLVVLKRILPHLAEQAKFVTLFLDEARTAADLRHPNVVQIYDVGEADGTYYLAMEYLHGQNLRHVERAAAENGKLLPLGFTLRVVLEAAQGLHHAHRKLDMRGKPLGIVHRDVSPHNLIVTYEGITKVVDFGIAKVSGARSMETETGRIRGKIAYMSPEQVRGARLDARVDQFALGIVLFELTTGTRLFLRENDVATMQAVMRCEVPDPTTLSPEYPPQLSAIVRRTLAWAPEDRFATCEELAEAIEEFLQVAGILHSTARQARVMREMFGTAADETRVPEEAKTTAAPGPVLPAPSGLTAQLGIAVKERRTNLAADAGLFVGREPDLSALRDQLIGRGERLVTIAGPGGSGKTRIARRYGALHLREATGSPSVWFCDLTDARSISGLCSAVASVLGVSLEDDDPVVAVGAALAGRGAVLLILDNLEQVVDVAAAVLAKWRDSAPDTQFLTTSRERMNIAGETLYELPPLRVPPADADPAGILASEAVDLFIQRARAALPEWQLDDKDVPTVGEIVRQLEGMPLAIELAAARIGVLTVPQLLERLPRRLDLLSGSGARGQSSRHATLRGTIDWSWALLLPWEREALAQLSVFRGGFGTDLAEALVDLSGHASAPPALDVLQSLRSKSLLHTLRASEGSEQVRFGMYKNIHEYAAEKLAASGRTAQSLSRHTHAYLEAATTWVESLDGLGGLAAMQRLALEEENLVVILVRAIATTPPTLASATRVLRALALLEPILAARGPYQTYLDWVDKALAIAAPMADQLPARLLGRAHEIRGWVRRRMGARGIAQTDLAKALALARSSSDKESEGRLLARIGDAEFAEGRAPEALVALEEARTILEGGKFARAEAECLFYLSEVCARLGRAEDAHRFLVRALAIHRARDARRQEGVVLRALGALLWRQGKLEEARELVERALPIAREFRDRNVEGYVRGTLAGIFHEQGRFETAREHYQAALAIHAELGNRRARAIWLGNLGIVDHEQGKPTHAASRYARTVEMSRATGDRQSEGLYAAYLAATRADLGECDAAKVLFATANERLGEEADVLVRAAVHTLEGHLDVALHGVALREDRESDAKTHFAAAMARVNAAQAPEAPDTEHPNGKPSPAERSEDVRHAVRMLRRVLQAAMGAEFRRSKARRPT